MKKFLNGASRFWFARSLGILIIRLEVGFIFLTHGLSKVESIAHTMASFHAMGFPAWVGAFIGWLEVIGGIALILGIVTRVFAVAFGIEMLVAAALGLMHPMGGMISVQGALGGTEMFLSIMSFALALLGSGTYALLPLECRDCGGMLCDSACPGAKNP